MLGHERELYKHTLPVDLDIWTLQAYSPACLRCSLARKQRRDKRLKKTQISYCIFTCLDVCNVFLHNAKYLTQSLYCIYRSTSTGALANARA